MGKTVLMKKYALRVEGWREDPAPAKMERLSRWIEIRHNYNPSERNPLWDYVTDENGNRPSSSKFAPEHGLYLDFFRWNGRNYAMEQFLALCNPFWNPVSYSYETEDGKTAYLSGVDCEDIYDPISIEVDCTGERVRVYRAA